MGERNKLLLPVRGEPMVRHAVRAALDAGCADTCVVLGHEADAVRAVLADLPVRCAVNPQHDEGLGSSVRFGISLLAPDTAAVLCLLGDMPNVRPATLRALQRAWRPEAGIVACRPVWQGQPGNPVLWAAEAFDALRQLQGDRGARQLLETLGPRLLTVAVDDPGVLFDVDTPPDWQRVGGA